MISEEIKYKNERAIDATVPVLVETAAEYGHELELIKIATDLGKAGYTKEAKIILAKAQASADHLQGMALIGQLGLLRSAQYAIGDKTAAMADANKMYEETKKDSLYPRDVTELLDIMVWEVVDEHRFAEATAMCQERTGDRKDLCFIMFAKAEFEVGEIELAIDAANSISYQPWRMRTLIEFITDHKSDRSYAKIDFSESKDGKLLMYTPGQKQNGFLNYLSKQQNRN